MVDLKAEPIDPNNSGSVKFNFVLTVFYLL